MKKFDKFVHTIPLALAMQSSHLPGAVEGRHDGQTTDLSAKAPISKDSAAAGNAAIFGDLPNPRDPQIFVVNFPQDVNSWDGAHQKQYDNLVLKEALETISRPELERLDQLQKSRRRLKAPPSGEEILQRHRREKLDRELLTVLQRHVRLQRLTSHKA